MENNNQQLNRLINEITPPQQPATPLSKVGHQHEIVQTTLCAKKLRIASHHEVGEQAVREHALTAAAAAATVPPPSWLMELKQDLSTFIKHELSSIKHELSSIKQQIENEIYLIRQDMKVEINVVHQELLRMDNKLDVVKENQESFPPELRQILVDLFNTNAHQKNGGITGNADTLWPLLNATGHSPTPFPQKLFDLKQCNLQEINLLLMFYGLDREPFDSTAGRKRLAAYLGVPTMFNT
jgi:hypothetical protein